MTAKVAIVGAGPSGCYLAQALGKLCKEAEITVIEKLPVPFGLARYGVAPDHQGTKAVTRQFAKLFEKQGVGFAGNLEIGTSPSAALSLEELRALFDVVVLATGLSQDRSPGRDFEGTPGIYGSGAVTRLWNSHPEAAEFSPEFGARVVVLGAGNVAIDVLRLLAKAEDDFAGSDFPAGGAYDQVREIHLVGRSPADQAKFDPVMIRELAKIPGLAVSIGEGTALNSGEDDKRLAALRDLATAQPDAITKKISFHFGWPAKKPLRSNGTLSGVLFERDGEEMALPCDSVISAIGYEDDGKLNRSALLDGASTHETGQIAPGLYAAGWFKRGPQGTIPENRADSQKIAALIAEEIAAAPAGAEKPGVAALQAQFGNRMTSYSDWQHIDDVEKAAAPEGRCRAKISNLPEMLAVIENRRQAL
ncbi:MAG: FAD-dependent oxidoreductase [Mangrovicoccus sp.]|nr:FAD-dependent oxidoreductase [Mangrovicoccus sp.]